MTRRHGNPAIIVDPYSSGAFYAGAFKELGVPVVGVMSTPEPPDVYASSFRPRDFERILVANDEDLEPLISELVALEPRCILTGCESGVELTDAISPKVLPKRSNDPDKALARRHKGEMGRAVASAGLPIARQICTDSADEVEKWLDEEGIRGQDLVIKPPKSASTDGVTKINGGRQWREIFAKMLGTNNRLGFKNDKIVVQEFMHGVEYAVDTASYDGRHAVASICRYNKTDNAGYMAIYDTMDWMPPDFQGAAEIKRYARQVLDAVGVRYGTSHIEIMLTNQGPRLVEIGVRPHGGGHPQFCRIATGSSQVDLIARSFADNSLQHQDYTLRTNMTIVFLLCKREGKVINRAALDKISDLPSHHFSKINIQQGDFIKPTADLFASLELGFVALSNADSRQITADYNAIRELEATLF